MADSAGGLLDSGLEEPCVKWVATDNIGRVLGEVHVYFEGKEPFGPSAYSVRFGYHDGQDTVVLQRVFTVPSWQSLNLMGIMMAALRVLDYENLCADRFPADTYSQHGGRNTAIPREIAER